MTIRGIDVSSVQGLIDWPATERMGVRFAMFKCGEGNKPHRDVRFHVDDAIAAGISAGAYHFVYPLPHLDPVEQARAHFAQSGGVGNAIGELPPAVDIEWPAPQHWAKWKCDGPQIRAWTLAYLAECERLHGCAPLVYTYPDFWKHIGGASEPRFAAYPLWMADYTPPLDVPAPWTKAAMWQVSGGKSMRLPGGCPVDENSIESEEVLADLLFRAQAIPDAPDTIPEV